VVELTRSYRFKGESAIGRVSAAVRRGDVAAVLDGLGKAAEAELTLLEVAPTHALSPALARAVVAGYRSYLKATSAEDALRALGQFRVLAAHRRGFSGVEHLNAAIRTVLADAALVPPKGTFFRGRPVLITQNDYGVGLFNGDVGLTWPNARGEQRVHFLSSDGKLRELSPARLPAHETAFALSVHKSQGSEHDEIALVLPDIGSPLLTRELLYTAITRAKKRVQLFGTKPAIEAAVRERVARESGLAEALGATTD
jgi:exodeoxyribonuclease V alpha subunit